MKTNQINTWEQAEAIYSELAITRELAPAFGRDSEAGRGVGELYGGEKRDGFSSLLIGGWRQETIN